MSSLRCSADERGGHDKIGRRHGVCRLLPAAPRRSPAAARALRDRAAASEAFGAAWRAFALEPARRSSRVAVFAALSAGGRAPLRGRQRERYDDPALTQPLGGLGRRAALAARALGRRLVPRRSPTPATADADSPRTAFFPLYPLLSRGGRRAGRRLARRRVLLASYVVSLAALLVALVLLHRLTALELGRARRRARPCCCCASSRPRCSSARRTRRACSWPRSVGAFYAARTGHWAWAGAAAAAASRHPQRRASSLLLPLVLIYLYGPRSDRPGERRAAGARMARGAAPGARDPARRRLAGPGAAGAGGLRGLPGARPRRPAGLLVGPGVLGPRLRGPVRGRLGRRSWPPFDGARQLGSGSRETVYFEQAGGDPFRVAAVNLMLFGFLVFAVVAARRGAAAAAVRLRRLRGRRADAAAELSRSRPSR